MMTWRSHLAFHSIPGFLRGRRTNQSIYLHPEVPTKCSCHATCTTNSVSNCSSLRMTTWETNDTTRDRQIFILPLVFMHSPHKDFRWGQHAFSSRHDLDLYVPPYSVVGAPDGNPLSSVRGPREMTAQLHVVNVVSNRNIKIMKLASWKKNLNTKFIPDIWCWS